MRRRWRRAAARGRRAEGGAESAARALDSPANRVRACVRRHRRSIVGASVRVRILLSLAQVHLHHLHDHLQPRMSYSEPKKRQLPPPRFQSKALRRLNPKVGFAIFTSIGIQQPGRRNCARMRFDVAAVAVAASPRVGRTRRHVVEGLAHAVREQAVLETAKLFAPAMFRTARERLSNLSTDMPLKRWTLTNVHAEHESDSPRSRHPDTPADVQPTLERQVSNRADFRTLARGHTGIRTWPRKLSGRRPRTRALASGAR